MTTWPNLAEVRKLLRMQPDPNEDAVIQTALAAAVDFGMHYLGGSYVLQPDGTCVWIFTYQPDTTSLPDSAHQACLLHAARLYRRRDSLDGTIMGGDLGIVTIGRYDPDVLTLYGSTRGVIFA